MLKHIFNKDHSLFVEKKVSVILGSTSSLKKMTPNSDLQFIHKESGNSMTTAKLQSARLLPHWHPSNPNLAMHKDWSLQCHFLVLKSGPPFLTVVERGRYSNLHYD